jgi:methylamine---glutamate N-methyltransferase subunit B
MQTVDCRSLSVRQINQAIRRLIDAGEREILVRNPGARHNLAVAILTDVAITIDGPVGYYAGGMSDGVKLTIRGSAGWGVAECLMSGTVVVRGDAAARAGVSMKGGLLVIGGGCGYMTGFMMQRGRIIVCGDAGDALADSMYEGVVYVGGEIAALGSDAVVSDASAAEMAEIHATLARHGLKTPARFRKVVSGRKLWNYDKKDMETWKAAF